MSVQTLSVSLLVILSLLALKVSIKLVKAELSLHSSC
jgi:hypothetical protein